MRKAIVLTVAALLMLGAATTAFGLDYVVTGSGGLSGWGLDPIGTGPVIITPPPESNWAGGDWDADLMTTFSLQVNNANQRVVGFDLTTSDWADGWNYGGGRANASFQNQAGDHYDMEGLYVAVQKDATDHKWYLHYAMVDGWQGKHDGNYYDTPVLGLSFNSSFDPKKNIGAGATDATAPQFALALDTASAGSGTYYVHGWSTSGVGPLASGDPRPTTLGNANSNLTTAALFQTAQTDWKATGNGHGGESSWATLTHSARTPLHISGSNASLVEYEYDESQANGQELTTDGYGAGWETDVTGQDRNWTWQGYIELTKALEAAVVNPDGQDDWYLGVSYVAWCANDSGWNQGQFSGTGEVPELGTWALLAVGLLPLGALAGRSRRNKK